MIKDLKVAITQYIIPTSTKEGEEKVEKYIKQCHGKVDIVGLPEDCLAQFDDVKNGYDPLSFLSSMAKKYNIYLFGATLVNEDEALYNRGFLFDRLGNLVNKHDKVVLTPPEVEDGIKPGNTLEVFDTEFGKMSILVCKDSFHRYSAWFFDMLRKQDCDIVLVPSYSLNVSKRSIELWVDSLKALSKWFDMYILAPGTVGKNSTQYESFGHSLILSPNRVVLAEGSYDKEEILEATLDVKSLEEIRNTYGSKWQPEDVPEVQVI